MAKTIRTSRTTRRDKRPVPYTSPARLSRTISRQPQKVNGTARYARALTHPFDESVNGATVPDQYSASTVAMTFRREFTFRANSGGVGDIIIVPNLLIPVMSTQLNLIGGDNWILSNRTINNGMMYINPSELSAKLSNYRIVSYGVRVRGQSSMTTAQGKLFTACLPVKSMVFSSGLASAPIGGYTPANGGGWAVSDETVLRSYGIPYITQGGSSYVDVAGLVRLPTHSENSLLNLCENGIEVAPKICDPSAFEFRRTSDSTLGTDMIAQTSVTSVWSGDASYYHFGGHESVILGISGCTPDTALSVELVYHVEGSPQLTSSVGFVSDSLHVNVDPIGLLQSLHKAAGSPTIKQIVDVGLSVASNLAKFV